MRRVFSGPGYGVDFEDGVGRRNAEFVFRINKTL
jgi:hypothetical protein